MVHRSQGSGGARGARGHLALLRLSSLALLLLALAACGETSPAVAPPVEAATVSRVGDGDTLDLRDGRRVRLVQIDSPELGQGECYAVEARRELLVLAGPGTRVTLERDPELDDRDRYRRLLRYVLVGERVVNVELVRRGAATPYFRGGDEGAYARSLLDAVAEARASRRGMWGACRVEWSSGRPVTTRSG